MSPGDPASAARTVPRLVGGLTPRGDSAGRRAAAHDQRPVIELSSPDAAEMAKLLENVFRNVNIASSTSSRCCASGWASTCGR